MPKRSRASQSDEFDQPNYPNKSPSTSIPNNSFKPRPAVFDDANVVVAALGYISNSDFPMECFYCNTKFKQEASIYIYKYIFLCSFLNLYALCQIPFVRSYIYKYFKLSTIVNYKCRSLAFCKKECCEVQIAFDAKVMKTRLEALKKKRWIN